MYSLRFLSNKFVVFSHCSSLPRILLSMHTYICMHMSTPLFSFLKHVNRTASSFITLKRKRAGRFFLYIGNINVLHLFMLPFFIYFLYAAYYKLLFSFLVCFNTSSLFIISSKGVASLPTDIKRYTVLRSPHSDKKSREQFELRTHKRVFSLLDCLSPYYIYLFVVQNSFFLCTNVHTIINQRHDYL